MSNKMVNDIFIGFSLPHELYQLLLRGIISYEQLGNHIIKQIKTAHAFRQLERVRELSTILSNNPLKEYQLIGQYYLVWCACREQNYEIERLESIIDQTRSIKAQALMTRAAFEGYSGNVVVEAGFYVEALKANPDASQRIDILKALSVLKAKEGFHKESLRDFEELLPVLKYAEPPVYYDCLNSYAVELAEAGRRQEAHNVIRHVLASPFAFAYPEWRETGDELDLGRNRPPQSVVSFAQETKPQNLLRMPVAEPEHSIFSTEAAFSRTKQPARILDYTEWKNKMGKKSNGDDDKLPEDLDEKDMVVKIMSLTAQEGVSDKKLRKILDFIESVLAEPEKD